MFDPNFPPTKNFDPKALLNSKQYESPEAEEFKPLILSLLEKFTPYCQEWDFKTIPGFKKSEVADWQFNLPDTVFDTNEEVINFQVPEFRRENLPRTDLSREQLSSAWREGSFTVASPTYPFPYKWRISQWIIAGSECRRKNLQNDFSKGVYLLIYIFDSLFSKNPISVRRGLVKCYQSFLGYFNIFFGKKMIFYDYSLSISKQEVERQRQKGLVNEISDKVFIEGLKSFYYFKGDKIRKEDEEGKKQMEKTMNTLAQINRLFLNEKNDMMDLLKRRWQSGKIDDVEFVLEAKTETEKIFEKLIKDEESFSPILKNFILNVFLLINVEDYYETAKVKYIQNERNEFKEKIKKESPIRSKLNRWLTEKDEQERVMIEKKAQMDKFNGILSKEYGDGFKYHIFMFRSYFENKETLEKKANALFKAQKKNYIRAAMTHRVFVQLFPPYQLEVVSNSMTETYLLKRSRYIEVSTKKYFWRITLIFVRYFAWAKNSFIFLFWNAYQSHMSIKALFKSEKYYSDVDCDRNNGQLFGTLEVTPIYVKFTDTIQGIRNSRREFEESPDHGLFGKTLRRVFNLIECYVFRLIIVGLLIVLILLPIVFIVNIILSLILAITVWIWTPVFLAIRWVFSLLIFDFDSEKNHQYRGVQTIKWFPLITQTVLLVFPGLLQIVFSLLWFFLSPIVAFLFFFLGLVRYILRTSNFQSFEKTLGVFWVV